MPLVGEGTGTDRNIRRNPAPDCESVSVPEGKQILEFLPRTGL
jgi:hypothetical protein